MADKLKDAEDRFLESILRAERIEDDGFSKRVIRRIRQRLWLRRLALPVAMLIGGAIAVRPAADLVVVVARLVTAVPDVAAVLPPQLQGLTFGVSALQMTALAALLLLAGFLAARLLQE